MSSAAPTSTPGPLDMRAQIGLLKTIPSHPRPILHLKNWPVALRSVADYLAEAPQWTARLRGMIDPYPKPFRKVTFRSSDGTRLSAWLGRQTMLGHETRRGSKGPTDLREGVLIVPGMFTSKDNWIQKARALTMFRDWGYHVFTMDLRGFGESKRVFNTAGWKEADDVIAAVTAFRDHADIRKLHIYSESLGAAAAILAAAKEARVGRKLIDGGLLAVGAYADAEAQVKHISDRPFFAVEFYMVNWFFRKLLRLGGSRYPDFVGYLRDAADYYGVTPDDLYRKSSPRQYVRDVNVPTLLLNSNDDPVVLPGQADLFERILTGKDNPAVWRLDWGSHCLYEMLDAEWFWNVLRQFFDFHCLLPRPPAKAV